MKVLAMNAYIKWRDLVYGLHVPHNVTSTERMLARWKIKDLDELGYFLNRDKKLGPVTYNDRLAILKRFIKWCLKMKYIKSDPLDECKRRRNSEVNSKRQPYTDDELLSLIAHFEQVPRLRKYYYPFLMFLIQSGCRNGEAVALKCNMVDFTNRRIYICKNYARTYEGKRYLKSPKTASGNRYIPLSLGLEEILKPICDKKKATDFVFTSIFNNPIDDNKFQKRILKPVLAKLNIPERDLYACRHTFGTIAVEQNIDILSLAYLMGHRKARTVLDHYTKLRSKPSVLPQIIPLSKIS
jgi:integrase